MQRQVMGSEGFLLAVIAALAMTAVAFFVGHPVLPEGNAGICMASPNLWGLSPFWGWFLNLFLLIVAAGTISWLNKEYRVVSGSDTVVTGMFLLMAASNVWVSGVLSSTLFIAIINMACLGVLFSCYRRYNATRDMFLIGTFVAIGSMYNYALVPMIPVYLIGSAILKCFNFKVLIANLMGLAAPYWVCLGFGWISISDIKMPDIEAFSSIPVPGHEMMAALLNMGITALATVILGLSNSARLYAGDTRRRLFNMVINVLVVVCLLCAIFDFDNILAYAGTIYVVGAFQLANMFELGRMRHGQFWILGIAAVYIASFVIMV